VHHYYNPYNNPDFLVKADKSIGITEVKVTNNNDWLICQFRRQKNSSKTENYYDLNREYFVLAAYGDFNPATDKLGGAKAHEFKIPSSNPYSFVKKSVTRPQIDRITTVKTPATLTDVRSCSKYYD
jgi:hypothetical protein